jgi:hypothetical protein
MVVRLPGVLRMIPGRKTSDIYIDAALAVIYIGRRSTAMVKNLRLKAEVCCQDALTSVETAT